MKMKLPSGALIGLFSAALFTQYVQAEAVVQWSGNVSLDTRLFVNDSLYPGQDEQNVSLAFEPEIYVDWNGGEQRFVAQPFFRYDAQDSERSHADLREFYWRGSFGDVDLKVGVAKVFWGVAESNHLVDIINQTDLVENIDTEDKLGQPMVNLAFVKDWGTLELFVLPYFRERTFPGEDGRLRSSLVVDTDHPTFESGAEEHHVDFAVRWSHYIGDWDIGLAHFSGTSREPTLRPGLDNSGDPVLIPHYQQIDQTSLDLQATKGDWLWKLEAISSRNDEGRYTAFVGGFEYTLVGICDSVQDLGLLLEYHFDDRDDRATTAFQNDVFAGLRWVLNDVQSTEILAGAVVDADSQATFGSIEANRRVGDAWKVTLEARVFTNMEQSEPFFDLRDDDYLEIQLARYF
ncbi:MAG: hypothetical protein R3E62_10870 [Pseudomonadales bacterium]